MEMTATTVATQTLDEERDAFVDRLLGSVSGLFDIFTIYIGDKLGYYEALARNGWQTPSELATQTQTNERYAREWLEQQTVSGVVDVQNEQVDALERRFRLPAAHVEVLTEQNSLNYLAPLAQLAVGAVYPIHHVLDAFRTGGGVSFAEYGADVRQGQGNINRAMFLNELGQSWLPAIADVDQRLRSDPPARIADIGCGVGWSSIGMAEAYPNTRVDGFDMDEASVEDAWSNARRHGLTDRVTFHARDAGDGALNGRYDLVTAFECVHDMSNPVSVLSAMRRLASGNGTVVVMDERVGDTFTASGNEVEWMMYGWSVLHCLPVGMAEHDSAATGTVMRADTLRRYATEAGFRDVEILPIENYFFQFYRLFR